MATETSDGAEGGGLSRDGASERDAGAEAIRDGDVRRVELADEGVTVIRPSPAAEPVEEDHAEPAEEERGWSFAAKALTFLLLLLAGAGLGVWGAPKLAPMLPSGLAPVSAWLTPGRMEAEAEVAALGARFDDEAAALRARVEEEAAARAEREAALGDELAALRAVVEAAPDAAAVESQVQEAAAGVEGALSARIDELAATVAQADMASVTQRLGEAESRLEGLTGEMRSLREQLQTVEATPSAEVAARIDTNRAELDGLRAEVGELSGAVSSLRQQLEEARASADAQVAQAQAQARAAEEQARAAEDQAQAARADAEAQAAQAETRAAAESAAAAAQADLALIRAALESGEPFEQPLWRITDGMDVFAPFALAEAAPQGVQTAAELRAGFSDAAHEAIRASVVAEVEGGVLARSRAFLEAQVASRSLTPQEGGSTDAVLSRVEDALRRDDLQAALAEAGALPAEAAAAMNDWLEGARLRADAHAGLAELSASVSAVN